jgi:hypothetical protein
VFDNNNKYLRSLNPNKSEVVLSLVKNMQNQPFDPLRNAIEKRVPIRLKENWTEETTTKAPGAKAGLPPLPPTI